MTPKTSLPGCPAANSAGGAPPAFDTWALESRRVWCSESSAAVKARL